MTVDAVIGKYTDARGGLDKILAIQSTHTQGTVTMGDGLVVQIQGWRNRPDLLRIEFTANGETGKEGWDGKCAWEAYPWRTDKPVYVTGKQEAGLKRGSEFDRSVINYRAKKHQVSYEGLAQFDKRETHQLKILLSYDNNVIDYHFDIETGLLIGSESVRPIHAGEVHRTSISYSDYRDVDGVLFAFCWTEKADSAGHHEIFQWEQYQANIDLPDTFFQKPDK